MKTTYAKFFEADLNNNCPECYATDGLHIVFEHKLLENKLYKRSTDEVKSSMTCTKCNTAIYPERWTEDIERVYEYNRKLAKPPQAYLRYKPLAIIILLGIVVAGALAAFFIYGQLA